MARTYTKVLGVKGIIEQMEKGAYIYRVSGRFGGWGIQNTTTKECVTVRADSCRKVIMMSNVKEIRSGGNYVEYGLITEPEVRYED